MSARRRCLPLPGPLRFVAPSASPGRPGAPSARPQAPLPGNAERPGPAGGGGGGASAGSGRSLSLHGHPPPAPVQELCQGRGGEGPGGGPGGREGTRGRWAAPAAFVAAGAGGLPAGAPAGCGRGPPAPALGRPAGSVERGRPGHWAAHRQWVRSVFLPPRFILIFHAGTDFGGSLELSTPRCGRDIEVTEPDRFVPAASLGTGESWLREGSEHGAGGICGVGEVPAPCLERRFRPAVLRGGPRKCRGLHRDQSVVLGTETLCDVHLEILRF